MKRKLTKTEIDRACYPKGKTGAWVVWDTVVAGFGVRVHPSGEKSFVLKYRFGGKQRFLSLGRYGDDVTFGAAQARARELREGLALRGLDPAVAVKGAGGLTVKALGGKYIELWAKPRKRTWAEDERYLEVDVYPSLGSRPAAEVHRRELRELLKAKAVHSPIAANRLLAVIRRMFSWAVEDDLIDASPCVHLKPPAAEVEKERVLTADEIKKLWVGLTTGPGRPELRNALRLVLVTAQRPGEVIGISWAEVAGTWWTIPAARAKNKKAHRVPLSALALQVLGTAGAGWVFPSTRTSGGPVEVNALAKEVRACKHWGLEVPFTPHDLRRTAASQLTGLGVPRLVVSRILNHAEGGVTAIYDRHSYDAEKREALERWGAYLQALTHP